VSLTYGDLIAAASGKLRGAGIDHPRREARLLLQLAYGLSAADVIARERDTPPDGEANARFSDYVKRRAKREPLQHIEGRTAFYGLDLICDPRALIPRADSECVVEAALERLPEDASGLVADLGTGSGCLLLALLSQRPNMRGVGVEASPGAAALARENLTHTGLQARGDIIETSWNDWDGWGNADLIISNPPYIETAVIETLAPEVRVHDPAGALDGGVDGLDAYRSILALAAQHMKPGAWLVLEIGHDQGVTVLELAALMGLKGAAVTQDLGGNDRAAVLQIPQP